MLLRFTDQHPDVISLRETVARLEQQRKEELASLRQNTGSLGAPRATSSLVAQNLQLALNQTELDVAALQTQVRDRQNRVAQLRAQINTLPGVEAELLRLNRDYNVTKTEYERLLQRLESAKLSDAADRVDEVRFKVIDPPVEAILPARPKRVILILGVLLAAIGAGGGFAWLMSQLRPVFVKPKDLSLLGDVPVFGTINTLLNGSGQAAARKQMLLIVGAFALLLIGVVALIAVHPALEAASLALMGSEGGA
jgi:polysaccharide chain length determinant protein (PEP-CTERM system associated)